MKTKSFLLLATLGPAGVLCAQSIPSTPLPAFNEQKIGTPPLSLAETIQRARAQDTLRHQPKSIAPVVSFNAAPIASATPTPREKPRFTMLVIPPNPAVDFKLRLVVPDPSIDPKMIIALPGREASPPSK